MPNYSTFPFWRIPWTKEPGRLQYVGCKELDTTERVTLFTFMCYDIHIFFNVFLGNQNIPNKLSFGKKYTLYKPKAMRFLGHKKLLHIKW